MKMRYHDKTEQHLQSIIIVNILAKRSQLNLISDVHPSALRFRGNKM